MKPLLKVIVTLGLFFTSMLLVAKLTGIFDLAAIQSSLESMQESGAPPWIGAAISALLFADLFIAVPTLEVSILSGHLLGFGAGFFFSLLGVSAAGLAGYAVSRWKGEVVLRRILRNPSEREEMQDSFRRLGVAMILVSRAVPVLPEVSACLSGITGMPLRRFAAAWLAVNVPTMALTSYSGSISSLDDPTPAIATVLGLSVTFAVAWWLLKRRRAT